MAKRRSKKISHRRLAALTMAQLYSLAKCHREAGDALDAGAWLQVAANILSSAPPGTEGSRRGRDAPLTFGLSDASLAEAAIRIGVNFTPDQIERQVAMTQDWRALEAKLAGKPVYRPMRPDTIGRLLGVTEATRRDAQAWLIGTYDGSPKDRAEAYRQREAERRRRDRAEKGARPHSRSEAQRKPWEAAGLSRRSWYRLPPELRGTNSSASNKGANGQAAAGTNSSGTNSSATNKGNTHSAASNSVLASCQQATRTVADSSEEEVLGRIKNRKFEPAPVFRLKDAKPDGLIVQAVRTITRSPRAACPERVARRRPIQLPHTDDRS